MTTRDYIFSSALMCVVAIFGILTYKLDSRLDNHGVVLLELQRENQIEKFYSEYKKLHETCWRTEYGVDYKLIYNRNYNTVDKQFLAKYLDYKNNPYRLWETVESYDRTLYYKLDMITRLHKSIDCKDIK